MTGRNKNSQQVVLAVHITAWTDDERGLQHALALRDIADNIMERLLVAATGPPVM